MKDLALGVVLGSIGIVMVGGAMTGWYGTPVELTLWTLVGIGWVFVAHRSAQRPWLAVLTAGVASGLFAGAMQALFLAVLVRRNDAWSSFDVDGATRFEAFYTALPIGIVWGLLFAGVAWAAGWWGSRRRAALA